MKSLFIESTPYTPKVWLDTETNIFEISGESYSDDTVAFFEPIMEWLQEFLTKNTQPIEFNFCMNYLNTGTSKRFVMIISILEDYYKSSKVWTEVNWFVHTDDADIMTIGEDFQEYFETIPINIKFIRE
ncbi:DUF1987 domain-containing protein [uncultured Microscilla sp.]|uniref:DUF1987 domain-containing protein n=1 Tax=uncultured Microscilla sp. TaxID=432653 RepID=UPI00261264A9|nr:DUF1987 domain-containing protein [uncultured Microscilla sp.]